MWTKMQTFQKPFIYDFEHGCSNRYDTTISCKLSHQCHIQRISFNVKANMKLNVLQLFKKFMTF